MLTNAQIILIVILVGAVLLGTALNLYVIKIRFDGMSRHNREIQEGIKDIKNDLEAFRKDIRGEIK